MTNVIKLCYSSMLIEKNWFDAIIKLESKYYLMEQEETDAASSIIRKGSELVRLRVLGDDKICWTEML